MLKPATVARVTPAPSVASYAVEEGVVFGAGRGLAAAGADDDAIAGGRCGGLARGLCLGRQSQQHRPDEVAVGERGLVSGDLVVGAGGVVRLHPALAATYVDDRADEALGPVAGARP